MPLTAASYPKRRGAGMKKLVLVSVLAMFAAVLVVPVSVEAATVDLKFAISGGNLGSGPSFGFGLSEVVQTGKNAIGKIEFTYTEFTDPVNVRKEHERGLSRSLTLLKTSREGSFRFGLGGQMGPKKRAFLMLEVGAGSAVGTTSATYFVNWVYHPGYWGDNEWHDGYYEDIMEAKIFDDSQTYFLYGIGPEVELYLQNRVSLNIEAMAGRRELSVTWLNDYGIRGTININKAYYRGRFGLTVHF